jgi:hypothetical protein
MKKLATQCRQPMSMNPTAHQQADTNTSPYPYCTTILPEQTAWSEFPEGIEVIHDEPDATVDICFVHGLAGNRTSAWTIREQTSIWSKMLLASKLEKIRILTFGYNANGGSGSVVFPNTFVDDALRLLDDLTNNRLASGASSHPLIFVARGLGDLICKYATILSHASRSDLTRGVCQSLERIIHLGAPNETEIERGFMIVSLRTPRLTDHVMIDKVQLLFNSLPSTQNGENKETYIPFDFEIQSTQVSYFVNFTNSARLHMRNTSPSYGNRIDTTTLSDAGDPSVQRFITDFRVLIAGICKILCCFFPYQCLPSLASRRHETSRHNASKIQTLASTGIRAVRSSNNGGAPRFRRPAPTTTRPYARSHSPQPISSIQTANAALSPLPIPATNYRPTSVFQLRPCYIICLLHS